MILPPTLFWRQLLTPYLDFSGRASKDVMNEEGIDMAVLKYTYDKCNTFTSRLPVNYGPSNLLYKAGDPHALSDGTKSVRLPGVNITGEGSAKNQALTTRLVIGMRFKSFKVLN